MTNPSTYTVADRPKFLLFGDSLTQNSFNDGGWGAKLYSWYCRKADIVNRGCSGYNSTWATHTVDYVVRSAENVRLVIIWFGANDSVLPCSGVRQYVPPTEYRDNLISIAKTLQEKYGDSVHFIILSPPPVVEMMRIEVQITKFKELASGVLDRNNCNTLQYADQSKVAVETLRERHNARVVHVDIFRDMLTEVAGVPASALSSARDFASWRQSMGDSAFQSKLRDYFTDGLHFSSKGDAFIFDHVLSTINSRIPDLSFDSLLNHFPWHDQLKSNPSLGEHLMEPLSPTAVLMGVERPRFLQNTHLWDWSVLRYVPVRWIVVDESRNTIVAHARPGMVDDLDESMGSVCDGDEAISGTMAQQATRNCQVVDMQNKYLCPGAFISGLDVNTVQALGYALTRSQRSSGEPFPVHVADLANCRSSDECTQLLIQKSNACEPDSIILGTNWSSDSVVDLARVVVQSRKQFGSRCCVLGGSSRDNLTWEIAFVDPTAQEATTLHEAVSNDQIRDVSGGENTCTAYFDAVQAFLKQFGVVGCGVHTPTGFSPNCDRNFYSLSQVWPASSVIVPGTFWGNHRQSKFVVYEQIPSKMEEAKFQYVEAKDLRSFLDVGSQTCLLLDIDLFQPFPAVLSLAGEGLKTSEKLHVISRGAQEIERLACNGEGYVERSSLRLGGACSFVLLEESHEFHS